MELSEKLAELRRGSNLSQEELAEKLGVSRQAVSKWESGSAQPELQKLIELSNLYNVSVDKLLSLEHTQEKEDDSAGTVESAKAPEKLTPRAFAKRYKRPLLLAAALLLLLTAIFVRNSRRIRDLSQQVNNLQGQIVSVQQSLAGQIAGIGSSVEDILQREASLVSQYEYTVTDVDLEAQECTLAFSLMPKSIPEGLQLSLLISDEEAGEDGTKSLALTKDSFNSFRGELTVALSNQLSVSACFASGGETQVQQLDTIYGLRNRYSPQMLEFFPIRSYTRGLSNQPWQYCFRSGEVDMDSVIGYVSLGALGDRQIRKAYIDYVADGRSVQRVPLEVRPYESDMAAAAAGEKYFAGSETESVLADASGYDLYYAEEAKSMSFTLPLTPPLTIDLVLELSDGTVLRATHLTVKATQGGEDYEEVDYPKDTKAVSFSITSN